MDFGLSFSPSFLPTETVIQLSNSCICSFSQIKMLKMKKNQRLRRSWIWWSITHHLVLSPNALSWLSHCSFHLLRDRLPMAHSWVNFWTTVLEWRWPPHPKLHSSCKCKGCKSPPSLPQFRTTLKGHLRFTSPCRIGYEAWVAVAQ